MNKLKLDGSELYSFSVVCNAPVFCKAKKDRNQLGAWLDSDPIAQSYKLRIANEPYAFGKVR